MWLWMCGFPSEVGDKGQEEGCSKKAWWMVRLYTVEGYS